MEYQNENQLWRRLCLNKCLLRSRGNKRVTPSGKDLHLLWPSLSKIRQKRPILQMSFITFSNHSPALPMDTAGSLHELPVPRPSVQLASTRDQCCAPDRPRFPAESRILPGGKLITFHHGGGSNFSSRNRYIFQIFFSTCLFKDRKGFSFLSYHTMRFQNDLLLTM